MKLLICTLFSISLVGCAETAVIRVMDYGGALPSITGRGCAVHQSGAEHAFARAHVTYQGQSCTVEIVSDGATDSQGN